MQQVTKNFFVTGKRKQMLKDITVLMTGAGAPGAPGIIRCLRKNGERKIRLIGVDMNENAAGRKLVDVFYRVPSAKEPDFIDSILDICKKEGVQVVIPLVTRELFKFAENAREFEEIGATVSVMDMKALSIVNNKVRLLTKMRELGLETPEFIPCRTADEVEKACAQLGYPQKAICVKGAEGNGSRGVRLIDPEKSLYELLFNEKPNSMYMSYHDLMLALREKNDIPSMMVMELLPGEEYGVDTLCDHGTVLYMAGRHNYAVNSSIPQGSILENREEPFVIARELIEKLKMSGNVNFDFKYDACGKARLIEINPRLSATIVSYAPAGINFPYLRIKQLLGEELPQISLKEGCVMQRRYGEVFFDPDGNEIEW